VDDKSPPRWRLDPERMRQVLANLLRNALEASPTTGRVLVSVQVERGELVFGIRDHGKGIRVQDLERIFEPFYTTRARGTGLGLPIARRLVSLHGGSITAENAPEGGARFLIRLPAVIPGS
jgi:signal transduction histidine kinase